MRRQFDDRQSTVLHRVACRDVVIVHRWEIGGPRQFEWLADAHRKQLIERLASHYLGNSTQNAVARSAVCKFFIRFAAQRLGSDALTHWKQLTMRHTNAQHPNRDGEMHSSRVSSALC
jgi:hypothetical protein